MDNGKEHVSLYRVEGEVLGVVKEWVSRSRMTHDFHFLSEERVLENFPKSFSDLSTKCNETIKNIDEMYMKGEISLHDAIKLIAFFVLLFWENAKIAVKEMTADVWAEISLRLHLLSTGRISFREFIYWLKKIYGPEFAEILDKFFPDHTKDDDQPRREPQNDPIIPEDDQPETGLRSR